MKELNSHLMLPPWHALGRSLLWHRPQVIRFIDEQRKVHSLRSGSRFILEDGLQLLCPELLW